MVIVKVSLLQVICKMIYLLQGKFLRGDGVDTR